MRLSFVVPAYNEEAVIGRCIESILAEAAGGPDVEIVVVDNASTDDTARAAARYPGVVVVREERKGITFARQCGFERSTGDLIANVDADTMLTRGWIARVHDEFARDPALVCLSGPYVYHDVPRWMRVGTRLFYWCGYLTYLVNRYALRGGSMVQGGNFVCRRTALEAVGGFDTAIRFYGEDTDIAKRLHRVGRVKWTFALPMLSSGRRLVAEGAVRTGVRYALNYFWMLLFDVPFSRTSTDVRPPPVSR